MTIPTAATIGHAPSDGRNLTATIVNDLGHAIVTQSYRAGAPFPTEAELCERFNASRPVLREAVKMLTAKGLLVGRKRAGTIVQPEERWNLLDPDVLRWMLQRDFSIDLLIDFTDIRLAIEPRAATLASHSATGQQRARILGGAHAAADGQRHEADRGGAPHHVEDRAARLMTGGDIQDAQFVRAGRVIGARLFHRIAGVDQVDEIHALHHAAAGDVEAGDHAGAD
ncbi:hypothetical protein LTR94_026180, partial [Friedmanniomyces endolithicus]